VPPIPPPRASGFTSSTAVPLYWVAYGPEGVDRTLILHGGPGAQHDYLLPQMLRLAETRECVLYDQRGGGKSNPPDRGEITWRTQVADLRAVIAELALEPLTVVGYSWGGMLALLYAIDAAERGAPMPRRMVLIDPAPVTREYRRQFEAEFAARQASSAVVAMREEVTTSDLRERDPDAYRHRMFELSVAGYFADPRNARDLTAFRVTGRVQQSVWDSLGEFNLVAPGMLDRVHVPSLVIHGRQDPIPLASSEAVAQALGARLVVLENCGHVPYVEQPAELFAAIENFLGSA
jgi:proline iminopeptidase